MPLSAEEFQKLTDIAFDEAYTAGALAMKEAAAEACREHAREQRAIPYDLADHLVNIQRNSIIIGALRCEKLVRALPVPPRGSKI